MATKLKTLDDLLAHELKDLFSAEQQLTKALPKMAKAAHSAELREAFEHHLEETEAQIGRLQEVCESLGVKTRGSKCAAMEGLIEEGEEIIQQDMDPDVHDAALICAAQRVEHYEIAAYGCARTFAELLGHADAAELLSQSLAEESAADEKLTEIAMASVNLSAMSEE